VSAVWWKADEAGRVAKASAARGGNHLSISAIVSGL